MLNKLYKEGINNPVDITDYKSQIAKLNPNYRKRDAKQRGEILLKRMQENGHISYYLKDDDNGQRRVLAEILPFGHDFMEQKKSRVGSLSVGRFAVAVTIISVLLTAYFTYKSNNLEKRITELEQKVNTLQQSISNLNNLPSQYKKKKDNR
ncbi:hypothetical protein [Mucilaginibacter sp. OK098]|uniref:hypothetical protein n=1 Tax=Mucilaginibacter sp. OK098 TaxID=1855297 RepID=UPI0011612A6C|nr:hypothetical protein [Mucilaginibacter sp. OK098]